MSFVVARTHKRIHCHSFLAVRTSLFLRRRLLHSRVNFCIYIKAFKSPPASYEKPFFPSSHAIREYVVRTFRCTYVDQIFAFSPLPSSSHTLKDLDLRHITKVYSSICTTYDVLHTHFGNLYPFFLLPLSFLINIWERERGGFRNKDREGFFCLFACFSDEDGRRVEKNKYLLFTHQDFPPPPK